MLNQPPAYSFHDPTVRANFSQKVFSILSIQLFFTFLVTWAARTIPQVGFTLLHIFDYYSTLILILIFGSLIIISLSEYCRKTYPWNYGLLSVFTVLMGSLASLGTLMYDTDVVLVTLSLCLVIMVGLALSVKTTRYDFTSWQPALIGCLTVIVLTPLLGYFFGLYISETVMAGVSSILFVGYLASDLQMIMSGNHKYQVGLDDEVMASLILYLDFMNLFLNLLKLIQKFKDKNSDSDKDSKKKKE